MDQHTSQSALQQCRIKSERSEEYSIKKEITVDPPDEELVEFMITENPLEESLIKTEAVEEDFVPETPQKEDELLPRDPLEPTLRHQQLGPQAKLMLLNVIRYFQKLKLKRAKETGEDMNVNISVAEATGVSETSVKTLLAKYRNYGLERAIKPAARQRARKRKSDTIANMGDEEATATVTVKNKRKKN